MSVLKEAGNEQDGVIRVTAERRNPTAAVLEVCPSVSKLVKDESSW